MSETKLSDSVSLADQQVVLENGLLQLLPEVALEWQRLPSTPWRGFMLEETLATRPLPPESAERIMDNPPFWSLLWPSGFQLCRMICDCPELVDRRTCVDLGCGSGLVSVAASWAGGVAKAYDSDPLSRQATRVNCMGNGVECEIGEWWDASQGCDILFLADFMYDESNLVFLQDFLPQATEIVVVDSRLTHLQMDQFILLGSGKGTAVPDLDPHGEFGKVRFWYRGHRKRQWKHCYSKNSF